MEVVETSVFTRQILGLLSADEYRRFQWDLSESPHSGVLIRGGGGIRKIRVAVGARGKSGGVRVIYYWAVHNDILLLLYAYPKNEMANLTPTQTMHLARIVKKEFEDGR